MTFGTVQVPSFDSRVAMSMIEQELGRPWQQVYKELTPRPIAAASLGQASALHPPALLPHHSQPQQLAGIDLIQ